jgi:hypothetical protein
MPGIFLANHLLMVDKLSPVGLLNALFYGSAKLRIFFQRPQRYAFQKTLNVHTGMSGNATEPGFLFGSENVLPCPKGHLSGSVNRQMRGVLSVSLRRPLQHRLGTGAAANRREPWFGGQDII